MTAGGHAGGPDVVISSRAGEGEGNSGGTGPGMQIQNH